MIKQILCFIAITPLMATSPDAPSATADTAPSSPTAPSSSTAAAAAAIASTAVSLADPAQRNVAIDKIISLGTNFLLNRTVSQNDLAGKLGISVEEFVGYKATLESLLKKKLNGTFDYNQAETFAKKLLAVCLKAQTSKLTGRLAAAGVNQETIGLFKTLGYVVTKVAATGVCGSCCGNAAKSVSEFFDIAAPQG